MKLQWAASTDNIGVVKYAVFRDGSEIGTSPTPTFTDASATVGQHAYTVYAEDGAGNRSASSAAKVVTVADLAAPTAPVNLSASQSAAGVKLQWTASTDNVGVVKYVVFRDGSKIGTSSTQAFTDASATVGQHAYTVYAEDGAGNRSASSAAKVVTVADLAAPTAPVNLSANQSTAGVKLQWAASTDNIGVVKYAVFRDGSEIGTSPTPTFTDASATVGQHAYTVYAEDGAGNRSASSAAKVVTVADLAAPTAPVNLSASQDPLASPPASVETKGKRDKRPQRPRVKIASGPHPATQLDDGKLNARFQFFSLDREKVRGFACSIDRGPLKQCHSPKGYRVGFGRHVFRVRAIGWSGLKGPPAVATFRVCIPHLCPTASRTSWLRVASSTFLFRGRLYLVSL